MLRERIEKLKEKRLANSLEGAKQRGIVEVPLALIEGIVKKLETIEEGAQKNTGLDEIKSLIDKIKIDAETLEGFKADDFSFKNHDHPEFKKSLDKKEFEDFKKQLGNDAARISNNLISLFDDIERLRNDDRLEKEIEKIKTQEKKLSLKIEKVKAIPKAITQKELDKIVKELMEESKRYAEAMAQRAAGMSRGGGGPYVQATPPTNPAVGATWVDIS